MWEYTRIDPETPGLSVLAQNQIVTVNEHIANGWKWVAVDGNGAVWLRRRIKQSKRVTSEGDQRVTSDGDDRVTDG